MKAFLLLVVIVGGAIAAPSDYDDPIPEDAVAESLEHHLESRDEQEVEEGDSDDTNMGTENAISAEFEQEMQKYRKMRRYQTTKCIAKIKMLQRRISTDRNFRKATRVSVIQALRRVRSWRKPVFTLVDLHNNGVTSLLANLQVQVPKNAKPRRKSVMRLLWKLARNLQKQDTRAQVALRNALLGCARKCRLRERAIRAYARRVFFLRSLAKRKYILALRSSVRCFQTLRNVKRDLDVNTAKHAASAVVALSGKIVKNQTKMCRGLQKQLKARSVVFKITNKNAKRIRKAHRRTERRCSSLGNSFYKKHLRRAEPQIAAMNRQPKSRSSRRRGSGAWMVKLMRKAWRKRVGRCIKSAYGKNGKKSCGKKNVSVKAMKRFYRRGVTSYKLSKVAESGLKRMKRRSKMIKRRKAKKQFRGWVRKGVKDNKNVAIWLRRKARALALAFWLRKFMISARQRLMAAIRAKMIAARKHVIATNKVNKVTKATPKAAYQIISYSRSSGLKLNLDPKTGVAKAIRVNPGQFPPKYKWQFQTSWSKMVPISQKANKKIKSSVKSALETSDLDDEQVVNKVSNAIDAATNEYQDISPLDSTAQPTASLAVRAAVGESNAKAMCGRVRGWMDRFPLVLGELHKWYMKRRAMLWRWYLRHGNMKRYKKVVRALKIVYAHRRAHLKVVAKAMAHLEMKLSLQRRIAAMKRRIAATKAALLAAKERARIAALKKAALEKARRAALLRAKSSKSYPAMDCPRGYIRDKSNGKCYRISTPVQPSRTFQHCGRNKVLINGSCICRRGFTQSKKNKNVCVAKAKSSYRLSRVCKKGYFYFRHRCVQQCPLPTVANVVSRRCVVPGKRKGVSPPRCGKNMTIRNGRCVCLSGFKRARGGRFCLRYTKTFFDCRKGWFLNGSKCVRKCPVGLFPDNSTRVCATQSKKSIQQQQDAALRARLAAKEAAAKARLRKRQLIRAELARLADKHRKAAQIAQKASEELSKINQNVARLSQDHARLLGEAARHRDALKAARDRVTQLAKSIAQAINTLRNLRAQHKNAMGKLKVQLKRYQNAVKNAKDLAGQLSKARSRADQLRALVSVDKKNARKGVGKIAGLRQRLANSEIAHAQRAARRKARRLRRKRDALIKKAEAQASALAKAQRKEVRDEMQLEAQKRKAALKARQLAQQRKWQLEKARAKAMALDARAKATLAKCNKDKRALKQVTRAAKRNEEKEKAALKRADEKAKLRAQALKRAKKQEEKRASAFNKAKSTYLANLKAANSCHAVRCECNSDKCANKRNAYEKKVTGQVLKALAKKMGSAKKAAAAVKATAIKAAAKKAIKVFSKTQAVPTVAGIKRALWQSFRRIRRMRINIVRLRKALEAAKKSKKSQAVFNKIHAAARKIWGRIRAIRSGLEKTLKASSSEANAMTWIRTNYTTIRRVLGHRNKWFNSITPATSTSTTKAAPAAPAKKVWTRSAFIARFKKLSLRKRRLFRRLRRVRSASQQRAIRSRLRSLRRKQLRLIASIRKFDQKQQE